MLKQYENNDVNGKQYNGVEYRRVNDVTLAKGGEEV